MTTSILFRTNDPAVDWPAVSAALGVNPQQTILRPASTEFLAYCDGACSGNGRAASPAGGWGFVVQGADKHLLLGRGRATGTTNNRMELTAAIEALKQIPRGAGITLRSDSQYVIKGCTEWRTGWMRRGMKNSQGEPVLNPDFWRALWVEVDQRKVKFEWVRGHSGEAGNHLADRLATYAGMHM